jgi:hypothetical protein
VSTGSDRVERTRLAILEHIHRRDQRRHGRDPDQLDASTTQAQADRIQADAVQRDVGGGGGGGWMSQARDQVEAWWRYHPAHVAVDLARPALASYARRKPLAYLGIAAAAGAVLFMLRPWKLISVTGVVVALAKSPQVAGLVMSALSSSHNPKDDPPVEE